MRNHGFERPYNTMQVATWILLPLLLAQFLIFASPVLPLAAAIPVTVLFVGLGCLAAHCAYRTCMTDPIDDKLARHLRKEGEGENKDVENGGGANNDDGDDDDDSNNADDPTKYCWVCQTTVHEQSMHCKFCDKCVTRFDHHCMWLNTCVGRANYPYFYRTVVSTFAFVVVDAATLVGIVVAYFVQAYGGGAGGEGTGGQVDRMTNWFGAGVPMVVAIVNIVFFIITFGSASLLGQLFLFHINLQKEDITTYEYIIRENQRKREKNKEGMAVRSKRMIMTRAADAKGDKAMAIRLQMGRICVPCDPARKEVEEDKRREAAAEEERRNNPPPAASVEMISSSSSSDGEADQEEAGFKEEETQEEHDASSAHSEQGDQAPEDAAKIPLQEAMQSRKNDVGASSEKVEEKQPQFVTVGVTECTHPSASADDP